jgi:hypothetical protein
MNGVVVGFGSGYASETDGWKRGLVDGAEEGRGNCCDRDGRVSLKDAVNNGYLSIVGKIDQTHRSTLRLTVCGTLTPSTLLWALALDMFVCMKWKISSQP